MNKLILIIIVLCFQLSDIFSQELFAPVELWSGGYYGFAGNDFADVNGDGKADMIKLGNDKIYVRLSNGNSFLAEQAWTDIVFLGTTGPYQSDNRTFFSDVNGDGMADAIAVKDDRIYVRRSNGVSFLPSEPWTTGPFNPDYPLGLQPYYVYNFFADVTGDGKADAITTNYSNVRIRRSTGTSFASEEIWGGPFYAEHFEDMNGDYIADGYTVRNGTAHDVLVRISNGSSFNVDAIWWNKTFPSPGLIDVTGDGKADAINNHWNLGIIVKISTGSGFLASVTGTFDVFRNNENNEYGNYYADVTGDGKGDVIVMNDDEVLVRRSNYSFSDCNTNLLIDNSAFLKSNPVAHTVITQGNVFVPEKQSYTLSAGGSITLKPGFSVKNGAGFKAQIINCENAAGRTVKIGVRYEDLDMVSEIPELSQGGERMYEVLVSPNPANEILNVRFPESMADNATVELSNMNGKIIFSKQPHGHQCEIYTSHLASGLYLLKILSKDNVVIKKILIRH